MTRAAALLAVIGFATVVFWRTAYPTITWWDSSSYSMAAATLGISSSPGSLLLTLLGWPFTQLPLGLTPAYVLNLCAGVLAGSTAGLVYVVALRIVRNVSGRSEDPVASAVALGASLGALAFAFSNTLWEHAVKFTPYVLSALFTALILLAMLRWWEDAERPNAWHWLALVGLLFGLDFSVHRTNALLIPGALAWILVRHPRTLRHPQSWLAGAVGLAAGLAVQLLVMPIAAWTRSPLNMFEPTNWSRFWDYVSLARSGGGFLVDLWPRNSNVWSVQVSDFVRVLSDNFLSGMFGWLTAGAAVIGLFALWRRNRRLGVAYALVLFLHAAMTVLYFNIPANYFRSFDRHYLPVLVTLGVLIAYGMSVVAQLAFRFATTGQRAAAAFVAAVLLLVPAAQVVGNWTVQDASERYFTRDYAVNALEALPPNAIYFTVGDNDTFPVLYMQAVERVRPDVRIVNLSLANSTWYVAQIARRDSTFPVSRSATASGLTGGLRDTTVVIPIRGTPEQLGLPIASVLPDSITMRPKPRIGTEVLPADVVLLDIIRTNAWRDPITFAITAGNDGMGWLAPYGRLEGLFWRIVPVADLGADRETLRANLLERYEYRGYADPAITIDDSSRTIAFAYFTAFGALLDADKAQGATERCREAARRLLEAIPPERVALPGNTREEVAGRCPA